MAMWLCRRRQRWQPWCLALTTCVLVMLYLHSTTLRSPRVQRPPLLLTIFTVLKEDGVLAAGEPTDLTAVHTNSLLAVKSWLQLGPQVEVVLFATEGGCTFFGSCLQPTIAQTGSTLRCLTVRCRTADGIPTYDCLFADATKEALAPVVMYANADMVFFRDLLAAVEVLHHELPAFFLVGKRRDLLLSAADRATLTQDTSSDWADRLEHLARAKAISHSREGIDYFVYPRTFSPRPPAFLVGRIQWDNWVLLWAISHRALWTVECSDAVHAVHLDHGLAYGSHDRPGTDINKNLALNLPHPWVREFKIFYPGTIWLGRLDETDYVLTANTSLISLFAQPIFLAFGERRLPAYFSPGAPPARTACPHCVLARNWQSRAVVLFSHFDLVFDRRTIVLVFVPDVDAAIRRAQAWYCQATSRGVHNFLFVAADQDTAASLLATGLPVLPPDHEKPASANGNLNFLSVVYDVLFLGYNVVLCGLQHTPAASLQSVFTTDTDVQDLIGAELLDFLYVRSRGKTTALWGALLTNTSTPKEFAVLLRRALQAAPRNSRTPSFSNLQGPAVVAGVSTSGRHLDFSPNVALPGQRGFHVRMC